MANHVSALKRARQTERRTEANRANRTRVRTSLRALREALAKGDKKAATDQYRATVSLLDKGVQKGVQRMLAPGGAGDPFIPPMRSPLPRHPFTRQIAEREFNLAEFQKNNEDFFNFIMLNVEEKGLQRLRAERASLRTKLATNRAIYKLILSVPRAKRGEHTARSTVITALTARVSELEYQLQLTEQSTDPEKAARMRQLKEDLALT